MYVEKPEANFSILIQGDILDEIQILGAINLNTINIATNFKGEQVSWSVSSPPKISHAMVMSHSCEIDLSNKDKLTSIILAPIRDLNNVSPEEKIEDIIKSNYIEDSSDFSYLKYFYLKPNEYLPYKNGAIVDISKCFSVRKNSFEILLSHKILQLKPEVLWYLSFKAALYFHRDEKSFVFEKSVTLDQ